MMINSGNWPTPSKYKNLYSSIYLSHQLYNTTVRTHTNCNNFKTLYLSHSLPFLPHPNQESSLHLFQTKMNKEYSMMLSYGGAGGAGGGGGGPCGACKYLRRKCVKGCVFAPYFDSDQGTAHFAAVHRVFGASNASKLLMRTPPHCRLDAVITLCYEALARVRDPVYGCVAHIFTLQQQVNIYIYINLSHIFVLTISDTRSLTNLYKNKWI